MDRKRSKEVHARVLADARKRLADSERLALGWTWAQCLRTAYAAERLRREFKRPIQETLINWGN